MASEAQQKFFRNLTEQRQFPADQDVNQLRDQFANLDEGSASRWIEAALELPERGAVTPPWIEAPSPDAAPQSDTPPPAVSGPGGPQ